jgi:hypothetical protein
VFSPGTATAGAIVTNGGVGGEGDGLMDGFNAGGVGSGENCLTIGCLYSPSYLFDASASASALALARSLLGVGQCLMTVATNEKADKVVSGGERGVGRGAKSIFC